MDGLGSVRADGRGEVRGWVLLLALGAAGCVVNVEGAPCTTDANCPATQWCTGEGKCVEKLPTVEEACAHVALLTARRKVQCEGGEVEAWQQQLALTRLCESVVASAGAGTLTFDAGRIRDCSAAVLARDCSEDVTFTLPQGCGLFAPTAAAGASCRTTFDCTEGWCNTTSACPGVCAAFVADDAACTPAQRCRPGSSCVNGTCRRYRAVSEACSNDLPCDPYDAYCDNGTCAAKRQSGGCALTECAAPYRCVPPIFGGTCSAPLALGQPCTPGRYQCQTLARCSDLSNTCVPLYGAGGGCGLDNEGEITGCLGSRCDGNTCANWTAPGQACNNDDECGPLAHCAGTCVAEFCGP